MRRASQKGSALWIAPLLLITLLLSANPLAAGWEEAVAAFKSKDYATAEAELLGVTAEMPDWPGGHRMLGQVRLKAGKGAEAIAPLRRALELTPEDPGTFYALGHAFSQARDFASLSGLFAGRDLAPFPAKQRHSLLLLRAQAAQSEQKWTQAHGDLEEALSLAPEDAEAHTQMGKVAAQLERLEEAQASFARALELDPEHPRALAGSVRTRVTLAGRSTDGRTEAFAAIRQDATRLVAQDPTTTNQLLLAETLLGSGLFAEAETRLAAAIQDEPKSWMLRLKLARAAIGLEDWEQATQELDAALALEPDRAGEARIWRQTGFVHEKEHRLDAAEAAYTKAGADDLVARIQKTREIMLHNKKLDAEEQRLAQLQREKDRLQAQLDSLDAGGF